MKLLIIFILFFPFEKAFAEFFSGNDLLAKMNSQEVNQRIQAIGYVQGVFDVYAGVTICPPNNVTAGQVKDIVHSYLNANPALRHFTAESLANQALKQVWPCANNNSNGKGRV